MLEIPDNKNDLVNLLKSIGLLLKANQFKSEMIDKQRIGNTYSDALLIKYEQVFIVFESLYPDNNKLSYFANILKSINKLRLYKKYKHILLPGIALIIIVLMVVYL